jgi:UTP--glucose-1-phosphate uridylyltransferase
VTRLAHARERHGAVAAIAVEEVPRELASRYGIVARAADHNDDAGFAVADLVEKPAPACAPSTLAIAGRYVLMPEVFAALERTPPGLAGEVQLTDALRALLREGRPVVAVRLGDDEPRYDVGMAQSYATTFVEHALTDPEVGEAVRRRAEEVLRAHRPR